MRLTTAFAAATFVSLAAAMEYYVKVGQDDLTFTPPSIDAVQGDTITFFFNTSPSNQCVFANIAWK
jgi:plastocyanin